MLASARARFASLKPALGLTRPPLVYSKARKVLSRSGQKCSERTTAEAPLQELQFEQASRKFDQLRLSSGAFNFGRTCSTARCVSIWRSQ